MDILQSRFKGKRDDVGQNFTSMEFLREAENVSSDDIDGLNKILFPEEVNETEYEEGEDIDGGYDYKYLDDNGVLQTKEIVVTGGVVKINALGTTEDIYTELTAGKKCRFVVLNDKLIITNGTDYPVIYWGAKEIAYQMGAPVAEDSTAAGSPNGTYRYKVSYTTSGGEEIIGTISNEITVANRAITVTLPIGYSGTTSRTIYRTVDGGSVYKKVAEVGDNTTTSYTDNIHDDNLTDIIGDINNDIPKPYFIEVSYTKLIGCVVDNYPTQIFTGGAAIEMFDAATYSDISNIGNDNTPCVGMAQQFSQIAVGSQKNWYLVDASGSTVSVTPTSCNVGCKDGYSVVNIPPNATFPGGTFFLSTLNDVRVLNGLTAVIASTINNISTENWSQPIKNTLDTEVTETINIDAIYFNYMYHLLIGDKIHTFNTKTNSWYSQRLLDNDDNLTVPKVFFIYGTELYLGKKGESKIERMYKSIDYKGIDYTSTIRTGSLPTITKKDGSSAITSEIKYFDEIQVFFLPSLNYKFTYKIVIEDDETNVIEGEFNCPGGVFDSRYFSDIYYDTTNSSEDYRVIRIQKYGKWMTLELKSTEGIAHFRSYRLKYEPKKSKE